MATVTQGAPTLGTAPKIQALGGLIAGMALGMWTMIVEAILHTGESFLAGLFSPVIYIAATVLGGFGNPSFYPAGKLPPLDPLAIVLGLMGHMMNSVVLALIFFAILSRVVQMHRARLVLVAGLVYGLVIFAVMWYAVLPIVDPVMQRVNPLAFLAGHLMYGIGLGVTANWTRRS